MSDSAPRLALPDIYKSEFFDRIYLTSSNRVAPCLRIGLLVDSETLIAPFATVVDQIIRSDFARIVGVVVNTPDNTEAPGPTRRGGKLGSLFRMLRDPKLRGSIGWTAYQKLDDRVSPHGIELMKPVDCSPAFASAIRIPATPITKGFVHRFTPEVLAQVRALDLDVLLRFGFNIIRGDVLKVARYGVWSYHHGDNDFYRGGPSSFWETQEENPCTGVILQVLSEELDNGLVLDKAIVSTHRGLAFSENRVRPYLTASRMMMRAMKRLHEQGWDEVVKYVVPPAPYRGKQKIYRVPDNLQAASFVSSKLARSARLRLQHRGATLSHWRVGLRPRKNRIPTDLDGIQWIDSTRGTFWADPFLLESDGRTWLFFEEYIYSEDRGRISCAEVGPEGSLSTAQPVVDESWHLSNPFVFRADGQIYMIPEAQLSGKITLYRAVDFPFRWERERDLLDFGGIDTTAFQHDGRWWFFTTIVDPPLSGGQLCLFSAPALTGPLELHPASPVCADVRYARNGGRVHKTGNGFVRVAQDCALYYGHALHFRRISEITPSTYREEHLSSIYPDESSGMRGVHAWDCTSDLEVFDCVRFEANSQIL
jgi:hypothetical protein